MPLTNAIINASNTATDGYHNAMAGYDQRNREAKVDAQNAYVTMGRERGYLDQQKEKAFQDAAMMIAGGGSEEEAIGYLNDFGQKNGLPPTDSRVGSLLRGYAAQLGSDGDPANVQSYNNFVGAAGLDPRGPEAQKAARMALGLEDRADTVRVKLPGGGFGIYMNGQLMEIVSSNDAISGAAQLAGAQETAKQGAKVGAIAPSAAAESQTPKGRIELQKLEREGSDSELARQQQSADRIDIITAVQELREDPAIDQVYGSIQGQIPSVRQNTVDTEGRITRVIDLLTMANLGKMKGTLSDTDIKILANAGSILKNKRISPALAKQEMQRVERIIGKYEALMNPGQAAGVPQDVEPDIWEAMTPEERALWE